MNSYKCVKPMRFLFIMLLTAAFLFTGCTPVPSLPVPSPKASAVPSVTPSASPTVNPIDHTVDETKIKSDLGQSKGYKTSDIPITELKIEKRQTNKDDKQDIIFCQVVSENNKLSQLSFYKLVYTYYDVGGWILDSAEPDSEDKWESTPLAGTDEENIKKTIVGVKLMIDGTWEQTKLKNSKFMTLQGWDVLENEIKKVTIKKQQTDLKKKTDSIKASVTLESDYITTSGSVDLEFSFKDREWVLEKAKADADSFKIKYKVKKFSRSNDDIVNDLRMYEEYMDWSDGQRLYVYTLAKIDKTRYIGAKGAEVRVIARWDFNNNINRTVTKIVDVITYQYKDSKWTLKNVKSKTGDIQRKR